MIRPLLVRGMLSGLAAGGLAFAVAYLLGEGPLAAGIAFEDAAAAADATPGMATEEELVSRTVQSTLGLGTVALLYGAALGGLFALAFALAHGRLGAMSIRATAAVVALGGFVGSFLLPQLKYPGNPPGINSPDTTGPRTGAYLAILVISVVVVTGVVVLARRLAARFGSWDATLLALAAGIAVMALAYLLTPIIDETPPEFPASVVWQFRVSSLASQAVLWATIGMIFGVLTDRARRVGYSGSHPSRPSESAPR